jgi:hypothetical protein
MASPPYGERAARRRGQSADSLAELQARLPPGRFVWNASRPICRRLWKFGFRIAGRVGRACRPRGAFPSCRDVRCHRSRCLRDPAIFEQEGELSAALELRRRFPGVTDNAQARECARSIAGWKPLPVAAVRSPGYAVGAGRGRRSRDRRERCLAGGRGQVERATEPWGEAQRRKLCPCRSANEGGPTCA